MKFKRFLSLFFVVLLAVCIPCAFLAGCNGNSGDDGTDGNTSNNGSNSDKTYTGDAIFTEGMTLAQLRAATENIYNFTVEAQWGGTESEANSYYNGKTVFKFDDYDYYEYEDCLSIENGVDDYSYVSEGFSFCQDGYYYYYDYFYDYFYRYGSEEGKIIEKSLLTNVDSYKFSLLWEGGIDDLTDGEAGLKVNAEEIASKDYQVTSSYVRLKGSVLEYGYTTVGKAGTSYEGETEQYDIKIYGVNATVIDTGKIQSELADAEWNDEVWYNGYHYMKDVDKDGNEYYYVYSGGGNGAEETINTLPVKPRES